MVDINDVIMLIWSHNIFNNVLESKESIDVINARYDAVNEVINILREKYCEEVLIWQILSKLKYT